MEKTANIERQLKNGWDPSAVMTSSSWKITHLEETESTNLVAAQFAIEEEPEFSAIIADAQTGGRGRQGRTWSSPARSGLLFSVILRPDADIADISTIPLVMGLAVAKAIDPCISPNKAQIKWPNDILVDGKKICGILCELRQCGKSHAVIAGIGINVNLAVDELPPDVAVRATSMSILAKRTFSREIIFAEILDSIYLEYTIWKQKGLPSLLPEITERDYLDGKPVSMALTGEPVSGIACGIGTDGSLLLRDSSGTITKIYSGEAHIGSLDV